MRNTIHNRKSRPAPPGSATATGGQVLCAKQDRPATAQTLQRVRQYCLRRFPRMIRKILTPRLALPARTRLLEWVPPWIQSGVRPCPFPVVAAPPRPARPQKFVGGRSRGGRRAGEDTRGCAGTVGFVLDVGGDPRRMGVAAYDPAGIWWQSMAPAGNHWQVPFQTPGQIFASPSSAESRVVIRRDGRRSWHCNRPRTPGIAV